MDNKDTIAEFHSSLKLKRAFIGYDKGEVLESYEKLDALYNSALESERAALMEQIGKLTERGLSLESRVAELDKQNRQLSEENGSLQSEVTLLRQSDADRQAYLAKADILSTAMLRFEQDKAEQEQQLELRRQSIIEQANAEAKELTSRFQADYSSKVSAATAEIKALQQQKAAIVGQLRQLELVISQQVKCYADGLPERT